MATNDEILAAIPSTEPASFNEFCRALPDCPAKGERAEWAELFEALDFLESEGLVEIERVNEKTKEYPPLRAAGSNHE